MNDNFNHKENYVLEDDRGLLRPLKKEDWINLLPIALDDPDTWKYSLVNAAGEAGIQRYIEMALDAKAAGKDYPFIVFDKNKNDYAGSTRFYDLNLPYKTVKLGYTWYGKKFRRTGLNRHCKYLLLSFAFEKMGMERVEFHADANNEQSIAAMKAIGCTVEGILRSNMPTQAEGIRRDSIVLSILKEEWFREVKENLRMLLKQYDK